AIGVADGRVAGAVRLYPLRGGDWKGDRLAVLPEARHGALGARLVRFAVATAGARGGERMVAMIQLPNVAFFEGLGWQRDGATVAFHGRPHQPMAITLRRDACAARRPASTPPITPSLLAGAARARRRMRLT